MVAAEKKSLDSIWASASLRANDSNSAVERGIDVAQESDSFQRCARRYDSLAAVLSRTYSYAGVDEELCNLESEF